MTKPDPAEQHENDPSKDSASNSSRTSVPWATPQRVETTSDETLNRDASQSGASDDAAPAAERNVHIARVGTAGAEAADPGSLDSMTTWATTPGDDAPTADSPQSDHEAASRADERPIAESRVRPEESPAGSQPSVTEGEDSDPQPATENPTTVESNAEHELLLERWLHQVDVYTGPDALLDFNLVDNVHIDLTDSNPSGYAQLLAGRKTRLSTILRDRATFTNGVRAARAIRAKIFELDADHGLDAGYLAAGTASWFASRNPSGTPDGARGERRHIAPVLLAPIVINPHPDGDDFELRINGPARLNPAMVRQLRRDFGIDLYVEGVHRKATSGSRLTPDAVLEALRAVCMDVPGMHIEARTVISTFADLSDTVGSLPTSAESGLLRDVSNLNRAQINKPRTRREFATTPVPPDEVNPANEVLVYDADERVSEIVQRARAGESMTVTAPAGTQHLRAALNVVAGLLAEGKSVMVLAERRETLANVRRRLAELGLDDLTLEIGEEHSPEGLTRDFIESIVRYEKAVEPRLSGLHEDLVESRRKLVQHVESLRWRDERWGVSPLQAMQTLAELTSRENAPSTRVRFKRAVMDATVDREETVAQLERAAELRAFNPTTRTAPWYGARLVNTEETKQARALVREILEQTRSLRSEIGTSFESIGLSPENTLAGWKRQLNLLDGIRGSLKRFSRDIFLRPVTDLIAATASATWRRERGIEMSALQRSRLRRAAKEYIVPQVHIDDLHQALITVQEQREQWQEWALEGRTVQLPGQLEEMLTAYGRLSDDISDLAIVMEESPSRKDYFALSISELLETFEAMANDRFVLDTLPERDRLMHILRGKGLEELLADLEERHVPGPQVGAELDLAWWQSAFEIMLDRPEVNLVSGKSLAQWESTFRRSDAAHIASGPSRVRYSAARGWNRRVQLKPVQARELRQILKGAPIGLAGYFDRAPDVVAGLRPLWLSSPFGVGRALPSSARADAVVVLDAESTPFGTCLAALARTDQVVAFGDEHAGYPQPFIVSPTTGGDQHASTDSVESVLDVLSQVVPGTSLRRIHEARDQTLVSYLNRAFYAGELETMPYGEEAVSPQRSIVVDYLRDPQPDDHVGAPIIESPKAEVRAVVEMVFDHAARNPRQSLAVLTVSTRHAARIAEGVRLGLESHPELREFFEPGLEPFRILDLARAQGVTRDCVIFSLGVAPAAGSRASHFGQLAEERGRQRFVKAMTTGRFQTRVVSSLDLESLQEAELTGGMKDLVAFLDEYDKAHEGSDGEEAVSSILTTEHAGSDFLSVHDVQEEEYKSDWLLADLAHRLRRAGAEVALTPGQEVDGIATASTESLSAGAVPSPRARTGGDRDGHSSHGLRLPVGISTDGTPRYAASSVRERSRLRPERLERTGWNHASLWTVDVFTDPQFVANRILGYLGLEAPAAEKDS